MSRVGLTGKISKSIIEAESQADKQQILEKYRNETLIKRIVNYAYNPLLDFGMLDFKSNNVGKEDGMGLSKFMHVLDDIIDKKFNKQEAVFACNLALTYIDQHEVQIFVGILTKNLAWDLELETIQSVWPDLSLGYPVQYPAKWSLPKFRKFDKPMVAQKLYSGLRVNIKVQGAQVIFYTADGHPFTEFDMYKEQYSNLAQHGDTVFDGMAFITENGNIIDSTDEEIMAADPNSINFILWDAIRYDGFMEGKDNRIGYNWRANGLEHMMMLAIEINPKPCYRMPEHTVCKNIDDVRKFSEEINSDLVVKNLSGTWVNGVTDNELIFRK